MMDEIRQAAPPRFNAAEIGALAHLYRGEMYRSKVWRSRLDATTNWAVVTTGIALSATFASVTASPLPMVLVGLLVVVFLIFESRRYRYFDVWRMRVRVMETQFFGPILRGQGVAVENGWPELLADDYRNLHFHISFAEAMGRRLRRNYSWILAIQAVAYYGKLAIHPTPIVSLDDLWARAAIGPVPGEIVVLAGIAFHGSWVLFALVTLRNQRASGRVRRPLPGIDPMKQIAGEGT